MSPTLPASCSTPQQGAWRPHDLTRLFQTQCNLGGGLRRIGNRAQAQAHHGLQPFPRPQEVGLAPAEGRQTLQQLAAGRPQPKGEAPDKRRGAAVTFRSLSGGQPQDPGSAHSILPGCPPVPPHELQGVVGRSSHGRGSGEQEQLPRVGPVLGLPKGPGQRRPHVWRAARSLQHLNALADQLHSFLEEKDMGWATLAETPLARPPKPRATLTSLQGRLSGKRGCTNVPNMARLMSVWGGSDFTAKTMASWGEPGRAG